jgi:uncharacterized oxidoreductase
MQQTWQARQTPRHTVLVTGGSGGIGLGLAGAFHKAGGTVIICARNPERLERAQKEFPGIIAIQCDLSDDADRQEPAGEVPAGFPDMDVLVNNAGIKKYMDLKQGLELLRKGGDKIATNFIAPVELTAFFIGRLMTRPSAWIINISSGLAFMPMPGTCVYNATKDALHTYTIELRKQCEGTSVKVVEIVPPMVDTNLNKEGRDRARLKFRGISISEYIPTVIERLENDSEINFYGNGRDVLSLPRGETEKKLLDPS